MIAHREREERTSEQSHIAFLIRVIFWPASNNTAIVKGRLLQGMLFWHSVLTSVIVEPSLT